MKKHRVLHLICIAPLVLLAIGLFGLIVMWLWNALLPPIFGWKLIGFWQAVGLLVLARILFGGFGRGAHGHWRSRMRERWEQMTPEERQQLRAGMVRFYGWRFGGPEEREKFRAEIERFCAWRWNREQSPGSQQPPD